MRCSRAGLVLFAAVSLTVACKRRGELSEAEAAEVASREQKIAARLASNADTAGAAVLARWVLPAELKEISGLAVTGNGNVLAHNDEQGRVFVIDPKKGVVIKQFMVGNGDLRGDFEAIAIRGSEIFMLVSNGTIYRFREGAEGEPVPYTTVDTKLGRECEFEGIAVDAQRAIVLLPCKNVAKRGPKDALVIYKWELAGSNSQQPSMLTIPLPQLVGPNGWKSLHPSDMTIDPMTGNYIIIAAQEKALVVITPDGQVVSAGPLPEPSEQAEGVAILREGVLIISDEGNRNPATITLYRWPLPSSAASLSLTTTIPGDSGTTLPAATPR